MNTANKNIENGDKLEEIKKLIEFYFSDTNLRRDKFLFNIIQSSKDNGWIELSKIFQFNKIKLIIEIITSSNIEIKTLTNEQLDYIFSNSKLLLLNEEKNKIKRIEWPIKEISQLEIDEKIIYIEPITDELSTLDSIKQLLLPDSSLKDDLISHISIPKFSDKTLKGFAFIEFSNKQIANQVLVNIDTNPTKYNNLIVLTKLEWLEKKKQFSYLSNVSRYLKISNIPIFIINNFKNQDEHDDDDEMTIIDNNSNNSNNNNKLPKSTTEIQYKMNKPYLWKFFDKQTNINVSFIDYFSGSDKAILKFSSQLDLQHAIDQFQLGEIKFYNNILNIIHLSEEEITKLKQRTQFHEKSKYFNNNNNYNNNYNNNNNSNYNNYNKRKRD